MNQLELLRVCQGEETSAIGGWGKEQVLLIPLNMLRFHSVWVILQEGGQSSF